jgi:N-hydroxyarylamine O-acetyltransferase
MDIDAYLQRIHYDGSRTPTAETLRALHRSHMLAVPFENLDIHLGRPIHLDESAFFDKIVRRRRGGFCYELNGLFAVLLCHLGFNVTLLSAGVMGQNGFGQDFDHMTLVVQLATPWLADVGFGDSFREPLWLDERDEQAQDGRAYRLTQGDGQWTMWERLPGSDWSQQYRFTLQPRRLADYAAMCHYQQTSPHSSFTRKRVCSLATAEGRLTLSDMRLIITTNGERQERELAGQEEYAAILHEQFGIEL